MQRRPKQKFRRAGSSTTREDSPNGRRYREHAQRGSHILLFVCRRKQDDRRITAIVNLVAYGMTAPQIVAEYPDIEEEDVAQSLKYATWIAGDRSFPTPETA